MDWDSYSFVISSEYRKKILKALESRPKTPTELKNETGYYLSHISTTLKELEEKSLVTCLTPRRRKGKLFQLDESGQAIVNKLSKYKL